MVPEIEPGIAASKLNALPLRHHNCYSSYGTEV